MRLGQTSAIHFVSQFLASVVGFLATVALARIVGPDALGKYFLFVAVLIWLNVLGGKGLQAALRKRLSETGRGGEVIGAVGLLQGGTFLLLAVAVLLAREYVDAYVGFPASVAMVAALLATFAFALVRAVLDGEQRVHVSSLLRPLDRTLRGVLQVAAAVASAGLVGLVAGYAVAALVAAVVGALFVDVRPRLPDREDVDDVISFARYSWFNKLESRTFASMDTLVLGAFVLSGLVAVYEIAWNLASILALFGTSIAQSLFPAMSELTSRGDDREAVSLLEDALAYAGLFVVPGLVGSAVIGERVLAIYGEEFRQGSLILVVLIVARLIYVYQTQFLNTLDALDRPDVSFRVNLAFVGSNLVLNVVMVWQFGWLGAAVATTASVVIATLLGYRALRSVVSFSIPVAEIARQWVAAGVMGATVFLGERVVHDVPVLSGLYATLALVGLGAVVYFAALAALSERFRTTVLDNLPVA